jgi:methionyl-tRNA formyltransferase
MRVVFMGTPESAVVSLERLLKDGHEIVAVWTQPDRPAGRGDKMHSSPVKDFAIAHNLEIQQPARIKTVEARQLFASHNAEVAVVVAYGRILPKEFLEAPSKGCINVHFSLLPKYRGAAPVNWAIIRGEQVTGVTTMFIEEELDSGPILLQRETEIGNAETATELMQRLSLTGAELLSETLAQLNTIVPRVQDHSKATLAPMLTRADGLIDWSAAASSIERSVRGFQAWPNAFTHYNSRRLILWKTEVVTGGSFEPAPPGEVLEISGDTFVVSCGQETYLRVLELQPEAKRRMSAREFLNGTHMKTGDRFGEV